MSLRGGMSLMEMIIVVMIVGLLAAVALPSYWSSAWNNNVQSIENNLRAISVGEEKYYEDQVPNSYYISPGTADDSGGITSNLHLGMAFANYGFNYYCATSGTSFLCTASNPAPVAAAQANIVIVDANSNLTCKNGASTVTCP
jgi:prepilin-type N-terminal cleavage/methylation domain-containing protein